jgi:hypothetical protein
MASDSVEGLTPNLLESSNVSILLGYSKKPTFKASHRIFSCFSVKYSFLDSKTYLNSYLRDIDLIYDGGSL